MKESIFRKKSLAQVSSPEQLNDYIRVPNPGIWMILLAVIVLLVGVCVWGVFGHMDTNLKVAAVCKDGKLICYVKETDMKSVENGMPVTVNDKKYTVDGIQSESVSVSQEMGSYLLHLGELQAGEWVTPITVNTDLEDGTYQATITVESVSPMSFVVN